LNNERLLGYWFKTLHGLVGNLSDSTVKAAEIRGKRFVVLRDDENGDFLPPACLHLLLAMAWMIFDLSIDCVTATDPLLAQAVVLVAHVQSTSGLLTHVLRQPIPYGRNQRSGSSYVHSCCASYRGISSCRPC